MKRPMVFSSTGKSLRVLQAVLGLVLVSASLLKSYARTHTPAPAAGDWSGMPGAAISLALGELLLGAGLLSGLWPAALRKISIVVFAIFACAALAKAVRGSHSCGCFGAVEVPPWLTASLDITAVLALCLCKPAPGVSGAQEPVQGPAGKPASRPIGGGGRMWLGPAVAAVVLTAALGAGVSWETGRRPVTVAGSAGGTGGADPFGAHGALVVIDPQALVGKPFSLAPHIDVGRQLERGRWIVLLVHHDCDVCARAVPKYQAALAAGAPPRLAVVEMPPQAGPGEVVPWAGGGGLAGKLDSSRDWFATTPVAMRVEDGMIRAAVEGEPAATPDPGWWSSDAPPAARLPQPSPADDPRHAPLPRLQPK